MEQISLLLASNTKTLTTSLPLLNACLNALSTIFIIAAFILIRKNKKNAHKLTMIAAFITSTLFLISYITYHYTSTMLTTYNGEGLMKTFYFVILISHSVLAIFVPPLVIISIYLGLKGKLEKHKKIVKYAYPMWLYVSFTGVLVYIILHHFNY